MTTGHSRVTSQDEEDPSSTLKMFGAVTKALRQVSSLTQEEFASRIRYSSAYVAKIEQGRRFPPRDLPKRASVALGPSAGKVLTAAALALRRESGLTPGRPLWTGIEDEAITLYAYECRGIPELLQPQAYARTVLGCRVPPLSEAQITQRVSAQNTRQGCLLARPNTPFSFIIEQSVLERRIGGADIALAVVDHLLHIGGCTNVEVQIMPLRQEEHSGADGHIRLAEAPDHEWFGYTEGNGASTLITARSSLSILLQRYGKLRSQALSCRATVALLHEMRETLTTRSQN
ncbi:helix-turn-helix domain-containing protein [Streptomyces sp. NPDC048567]|uniref:helix-turn-helix domain-containing protein n=1 Tax=Streptomyces sp. NPDC048567 TaxID=3365570 RepID=UPI0037127420